MSTNTTPAENDSVEQLDERDARALTEYMSVLDNIGKARDAPGLYTVVGQNGGTYLVDTHTGACECPDHEYRGGDLGAHGCKHRRRVAFATGGRAIPAWVDRDEIDPALGEHVAGGVRFAATSGGEVLEDESEDVGEDDVDESPGYTRHVEAPAQGGAAYWRCEGCGYEILVSIGRDQLVHAEGCPVGGD